MIAKYHVYMLGVVAGVLLLSNVAVYASEMDQRIESSAQNSYVFKTYLKDDNIRPKSEDGVVTLTGTVNEESHRSLAQETVANLPGVERVDNQIQIKETASDTGSDGWISVKVKSALLFHRNVSGTKTQVEVKDGIVTLRGEADSQAQKDLTSEYARDVEGVKEIRNEIVVNDIPKQPDQTIAEKIDDASITAQVKAALLYHRSTSGIGTKVETNDGVVILKGKAHNAAEKDLVTKIVSDINGVKRVVNNMEI